MREYPWRHVTDPYAVIVAEFMLHRTQARQVRPIYEAFLARYPSLTTFALAHRKSLDKLLKPLGLQWRIRGMLDALNYLNDIYSEIPVDYDVLMNVPGIGQYIAGATVCFTRNAPLPLVDSNTVRVVGRVFGFDLQGEARRNRQLIETIERVCDPGKPRDFYYSLIDLSHMICRPTKPLCATCPLVDVPCVFGGFQLTASSPAKHSATDRPQK